jgi:hypothetical protein
MDNISDVNQLITLFQTITPELLGKICSFTDDNTIYNLLSSSRLLYNSLKDAKDYIHIYKANEPKYDKYPLFRSCETIPQYLQHDTMASLNIQIHTKIEDIHNFETTHDAASVIVITPESLEHAQISHLVTSIKVKGNIRALALNFAKYTLIPEDFPISALKAIDEEGYIEILHPFVPFLPLFCVDYFDTTLALRTKGPISIKVQKCRVSPYYINHLQTSSLPCIVPIMRTNIIRVNELKSINGQTDAILVSPNVTQQSSIGMSIFITNNQGQQMNIKNIRAFILEINDEPSQIISARSTHISCIQQTPYYNNNIKFKYGFYMPLPYLLPYNATTHLNLKLKVVTSKPQTVCSMNVCVVYYFNDTPIEFDVRTQEEPHFEI